jgi:transmembrane sensor
MNNYAAHPIPEHIPEHILDQACHWSVLLGDKIVSGEDQREFNLWREADPLHEIAWQRLQLVEQELIPVRPLAQQNRLILQDLASARRQRRTVFASALSCLLLAGFSVLLFPHAIQNWQADYVTAKGVLQQINLDGGALLYIDTDSALDVETTAAGIAVHLHRGRILVDSAAAAPANKPHVITEDSRFTPTGTRFVVSKRNEQDELIVTQGQVKVETAGHSRLVDAGNSVRIAHSTISPLSGTGLAADAWVDGVIEANNARLGDVLDALAQHRRGWLRYDAQVADLRVNGIFHLKDSDKALSSLANTLPITINRHTDWWISVIARQ